MLTIKDLHQQDLLLFEAISGSHAYGLSLPTSDVDIKGVYVLPKHQFYGLDYVPQVNDAKNDVVYYELRRFVELLAKNNPNLLELLNTPEDCVRYQHPLFEVLEPTWFLSKQCKDSFGGYAWSQIKKARGLNKKISNPMSETRKTVLDFCFVNYQQGSLPLTTWLQRTQRQQEHCGLVAIPHMHDLYGVYYDPSNSSYQGIVRPNTVDTLILSSIPKDAQQVALLHFNQDGYRKYCKDYKQYWTWVRERNEHRYQGTLSHGQQYDAKNMMHTFRLLDMAEEILREGDVRVRRPNREQLLAIRRGEHTYDTLMEQAAAKMERIQDAYTQSSLPERPNYFAIEAALVHIREQFYRE